VQTGTTAAVPASPPAPSPCLHGISRTDRHDERSYNGPARRSALGGVIMQMSVQGRQRRRGRDGCAHGPFELTATSAEQQVALSWGAATESAAQSCVCIERCGGRLQQLAQLRAPRRRLHRRLRERGNHLQLRCARGQLSVSGRLEHRDRGDPRPPTRHQPRGHRPGSAQINLTGRGNRGRRHVQSNTRIDAARRELQRYAQIATSTGLSFSDTTVGAVPLRLSRARRGHQRNTGPYSNVATATTAQRHLPRREPAASAASGSQINLRGPRRAKPAAPSTPTSSELQGAGAAPRPIATATR